MADKPGKGKWLWAAGVLLLAAGALFRLKASQPALVVETVRIERGEVREIVPSAASGRVAPQQRATVRAEIPGTVTQVVKKRGDRVAAGELVVEFAADELDARLAQARANLDVALVALQAAKTRQNTTSRALERAKKLEKGGAISRAELDRAETEHVASGHKVSQAEATRKQASAAVKLTQVARARALVKAPFDGIIQDVFCDPGVQVAPGGSLFDLIDDRSVHIDVPVDEADIEKITVDQTVLLRTTAQSTPWTGKVAFIPPAVGRAESSLRSAVGQDRSVYVEVLPDEPDRFRVGASVNAEFLVSAKQDVLFLPSHVVIGRGVERAVFRIEGGRARRVFFRPGLTSWDRTEIVSGLELGEQVVASLNHSDLEDGVRVQPAAQPESKSDAPDPQRLRSER